MIDKTDFEIMMLLRDNARMQLNELGDRVHLTGQAVSNRIKKLEALGIIKSYSVILDEKSKVTFKIHKGSEPVPRIGSDPLSIFAMPGLLKNFGGFFSYFYRLLHGFF